MNAKTASSGKVRQRAPKPSGVDWLRDVPTDWKVVRLRYCASVNPTASETSRLSENTEVTFAPMESIGAFGGIDLEKTKVLADVSSGYTYFRDGDVVVAKITPCFENGKGALAENLTNGIGFGTTELHVIRPGDGLDKHFLFYLTISHPFREIGAGCMYGAGGQKRVPDEFVRNFRTPLPALDEQRAIAAFLDRETARIDGLIAKKERQIELLREKRAALISHAVTKGLDPKAPMKPSGIEWLGDVPAHWKVGRLGYLARNLQTGPFGSQLHAEDYVDGGVPVINPAQICDAKICPDIRMAVDDATFFRLRQHELQLGDLILGRRGEMGRCAVVTEGERGFLCGTGCIRLRLDHSVADPRFISLYIGTDLIRDYLSLHSVGATMENLNTGIVSRVPVSLPPLREQTDIVENLESEHGHIASISSRILESMSRLLEFRSAIISAAVTGKIDVREG